MAQHPPTPAVALEDRAIERLGRMLAAIAGPLIGLALVMGIFGTWHSDLFWSGQVFDNVLRASYPLAIAAVGATFVIVTGGIDLSVGSTMALSCVITAMAMRDGSMPPALALLVGVLTGTAVGLLNGSLVTGLKLPPFIATLATLGAIRGLTEYITNGVPVSRPDAGPARAAFDQLESLHFGNILGLAPNIWIALLVILIGMPLLHLTIMGRYAYAIGSNERTARLCGVRVERWKIAAYAFAGLCAGLAGAISTAKYGAGQPTEFAGVELEVIAAVVIGGTSLFGGEGTILGTVLGVLMLGFLRTGCNIAEINTYVQKIFIGGTIVLAAALDRLRHRRG